MHILKSQLLLALIGLFVLVLCGCDDGGVAGNSGGSTITRGGDRDITISGNGTVTINGKVMGGGGPTVKGSGVATTESREVGEFNKISVSTAVDANITVGETQSITVSSDDNIVPLVKTEVKDDVLNVYLTRSMQKTLPIEITIAVPKLTSLTASGSCNTNINGVDSPEFEIHLSGACGCTIVGKTDSFDCSVSGASKVTANELVAKNVKVIASGASHAKVFAEEAIDAGASGASNVQFAGKPSDVTRNKSGASTIKAF